MKAKDGYKTIPTYNINDTAGQSISDTVIETVTEVPEDGDGTNGTDRTFYGIISIVVILLLIATIYITKSKG